MKTLLIMTVGQTDVQLVISGQRHKLDGSTCGTLHDAIMERSWSVVDDPRTRNKDVIRKLPDGPVDLCTPKLDAVLTKLGTTLPTSALIFETTRNDASDPRFAGEVLERRLRERGVNQVIRVAFLTGTEKLEDPSNDVDAVVRRTVVATLSDAIREQVEQLSENAQVFCATTGGLANANDVIEELVRLHAVGRARVTLLEVPDSSFVARDDCAVEEKFHPAAGYRARWQALSLVEKGNLLGAWGAVSHLKDEPGQEWTEVIQWLGLFASSLPLPKGCDLAVLSHQRMAVRAALRVELALRAGDIPRAVHGTVAFFEAALWDKLAEKTSRHATKRLYRLNEAPAADLIREVDETKMCAWSKSKRDENKRCPFILEERAQQVDWYRIDDSAICAARLAKHYLKSSELSELAQAISEIRTLRNDVAHNEPTTELMEEAKSRMQTASLWSNNDTFLSQPLVQAVLRELGEQCPERLCDDFLSTVRERLLVVS